MYPHPIIAINYYFGPGELKNQIFARDAREHKAYFMQAFRRFMDERGFDVVTLDMVDFKSPQVKYVVYFEYNWRMLKTDPFLDRIPYEKRVLVLIEPANVNPSMYYLSCLRNRFKTVFTWDLNLLKKNPSYVQVNVPVGAEPGKYRDNPFGRNEFSGKKFLTAISRNRWSYMPQSTYSLRKKAYRFFERKYPNDFDLYGFGWNEPCIFYERWFGYHTFKSWRGSFEYSWDLKVEKMAEYKFALCFENNAHEPGYISEKILDCFCARCVPVYYGSAGIETLIPQDAFINLKHFANFNELAGFLENMDEAMYEKYQAAINDFMKSKAVDFFSTRNFFSAIANRLIGRSAENE